MFYEKDTWSQWNPIENEGWPQDQRRTPDAETYVEKRSITLLWSRRAKPAERSGGCWTSAIS